MQILIIDNKGESIMKKRVVFTTAALAGGAVYAYKKIDDSVNNIPKELKRTRKVYEFAGDYTAVTVSERVEDIIVKQSDDDILRVVCYENGEYYYDIIETDQLIVTPRINADYFGKFKDLIRDDRHFIEVHIPKRLNANLIAKNKTGKVSVKNLKLKNLFAMSTNGAVVVSDVDVENACAINNSNGVINAENILATTVNIKNTNGKTIVYNVVGSENVCIESKNGSILGIGAESKGALAIENRNGNIDLTEIEFNEIANILNKNGKINISLAGSEEDYCITTTSTFDVNTPTGVDTGKPLNVTTRYGSVNIDFEM